ncbi:MAG: MFS transporter, partial [Ktedonobacteraceae bacterium]|nr:MFS transporter [Ktedonobacteraceae bacterium]
MLFFAIATLALGTFAIGTDEYIVAGLLPNIASDMHVAVSLAGQLISVFALTYAIGSPALTMFAARCKPKHVLIGTMFIYVIVNAVVLVVPSAHWLFATRFLAALAASLYTPTALAAATALV